MDKIKFVKVSVKDRLPKKTGFYYVEKNASKLDKLQVSRYTIESMEFMQDDVRFWFEPVPDREDEMRELLEEYVQAIENETIIVKENEDNDGWENFGGRFYDKAKKLINEQKQ